MDTCDICGGALINTGDTDARQEWVTESFCCEECNIEFTKRTDFHSQTSIPAVIELSRDWHEEDGDEDDDVITVYRYEYTETGASIETITYDEIKELVQERGLNVDKVIDAVIEINGIIGVGLITLGDQLKGYVNSKIK